ncbi:rRNA maturation RNase YbeY [bacterium]|nr:rRNA maturation RNase YbeY [bacterium]
MLIEINNQTKARVNQKYIRLLLRRILLTIDRKLNISVAIVGRKLIKRLNRKYRGKNKVTNVLSFSGLELSQEKLPKGEIIICWPVIKKEAKVYKRSIKEELKIILIHSVLHLLGFEHGKKMRKKEKNLLNKLRYV